VDSTGVISSIAGPKLDCLQAFAESSEFVNWIKQEVKGIKLTKRCSSVAIYLSIYSFEIERFVLKSPIEQFSKHKYIPLLHCTRLIASHRCQKR